MTSNGRIVVIAGSSSEAGKAIASALQQSGATVVALGSDEGRLQDVAAHARFVCDLADGDAVAALALRIHDEVGAVDGLIHLVGGWRTGHDDEGWAWLESRLLATLRHTTSAFRDDLASSPAGRLAIVSSTSVDRPTWSNANYAAAKGAAEAWVGAVASGWAKAGTAAAVTFVVRAIGTNEGYTSVDTLAHHMTDLWKAPVAEINGARIRLHS